MNWKNIFIIMSVWFLGFIMGAVRERFLTEKKNRENDN